jgi:protein SCO1/2
MLALRAAFEAWLVFLLLWPASHDGLGSFADELRIWCFGVDAAGEVSVGRIATVLSEPVLLAAIIGWIWGPVLRWNRSAARVMLVTLAVAAAALVVTFRARSSVANASSGPLAFPAQALRTAYVPPDLSLTDQTGVAVTLKELRGRVVVLTGIYASCTVACPIIMGEAKRALGVLTLDERSEVTWLAVTLAPRVDTQAVRATTAERYGVRAPEFRLLGGEPSRVEAALDALQIARNQSAHTAIIEHASLFILVDRSGRLAYRLPVGGRGDAWLVDALRVLLHEPRPAS